MSNPIADLSYRTYDGPLRSHTATWQVIAKMHLMGALQRKAYWGVLGLSAWYYVAFIVVMSFLERLGSTSDPQLLNRVIQQLTFKDQPLIAYTISQLPLMVLTIMLCSGAIANDRRSNALLVYLSKPCSQFDYTLGKLVGTWIPIFLAMLLPGTLFFGIGALSYRQYGFLANPWLLPLMIVTYAISSLFFVSIALFLSSLVKQSRIAGAMYAGLYLISGVFAQMMYGVWTGSAGEPEALRNTMLSRLTYGSVDGVTIAFGKSILQTNGSSTLMNQMNQTVDVPFMPLWIPSLIMVSTIVFCLWSVWRRVKAVEVIG